MYLSTLYALSRKDKLLNNKNIIQLHYVNEPSTRNYNESIRVSQLHLKTR